MPTPILALLIVVVALYGVQLGLAAWGFARVRRAPGPAPPDEWPSVSVVVPARNEADDIDTCLDSLRACDYPDDKLEIIVVDDFSTDGTPERVRQRQPAGMPATADPVRLVKMAAEQPENGNHKPAAVATGVDAATGDVILTTDADCTVPSTWIRSMVRRCTPETPFVAGPVAYEHADRFLPRLQALELMGLIGYGAGTLGIGLPTFCNSANVAYRREAIDALAAAPNGAAQDELLLQHVAYDTERDVTFNPDPAALVTTAPTSSFSGYLAQQARWAHMGLRYPFVLPKLMVVGLWAAHVALFLACAAALALPAWREPVLTVFLAKMGVDALLAVPPAKHFGQRGLLRSAVPTELLLLVAVPIVGIVGTFGPLEWKGRELE
ncbi:glycosyltransferase [Salinibacter sp. 10B]|uniref:glycosyltransferase n=1 Tax=Salinibacter sp. 10B TaxID=1923971 RepID=UPI001C614FAA|nr:glycosyltransferase [Salinibacter sp. 10B]